MLASGGTDADANRAATDSLIDQMASTPGIAIAQDAPAAVKAAKAQPPANNNAQTTTSAPAAPAPGLPAAGTPAVQADGMTPEQLRNLPEDIRNANRDLADIDKKVESIAGYTPINPRSIEKQSQEIARLTSEKRRLLGIGATQEGADLVNKLRPDGNPQSGNATALQPQGTTTDAAKIENPGTQTSPAPSTQGAAPAGAAVGSIDDAAHQAATSPNNALAQPTDGQKKAGNYAKGHVNLNGLDLSIENPAGSERSGTDKGGKAWKNTLKHHYGYIKGTVGNDKDHVDLFVKPGTPLDFSGEVYVIDQVHPDTGKFDEHKVMTGFANQAEAKAAYHANYAKGWKGMKALTPMSFSDFSTWVKSGPKNTPLSEDPSAVQSPFVPPLVTGMIQAATDSASSVKDRITNVRYAPTDGATNSILFDLDGKPMSAVLRGRNADAVLMGNNAESDKGWAARALLDGDAQESKPPKKQNALQKRIQKDQQARADYFTPGNIVKSYSGHDRVIGYTPPFKDGGNWSVRVQSVVKQGDKWVNDPKDNRERQHSTPPDAKELASGPVFRNPVQPQGATSEPKAYQAQQAETQRPQEPAAAAEPVASGKVDTVDSIARAINLQMETNRRNNQRKIREENAAKGVHQNTTEESERTNFESAIAAGPLKGQIEMAEQILAKDPVPLIHKFVYGNFEASEMVFAKVTGVKIKGLSMAAKKAALYKWAGWTDEQIADAEKAAEDRESSQQAGLKEEAMLRAVTGAWRILDGMQVRMQDGEVLSGQKALLSMVRRGLDEVVKYKKGIVTVYGLKGAENSVSMKDKRWNAFLKAAEEFGGMKKALELVKANAGESIPDSATKPAAAQTESTTERTATEHAGLKIYPTKVKMGDTVVDMWGVQTPDNAQREKNGERQIGGDPLSETLDGAKKNAEAEVRDAKSRAEREAESKAADDAAQAKKDANKGKSLLQRRADALLDKQHTYPPQAGLGQGTRREAMQKSVDQGRAIVERMVPDTAAKHRDQTAIDLVKARGYILGLSNENIPVVKQGLEAQARMKADQYEKPEYRVYDSAKTDGGFYEITKTEFDYAKSLEAKPAEVDAWKESERKSAEQDEKQQWVYDYAKGLKWDEGSRESAWAKFSLVWSSKDRAGFDSYFDAAMEKLPQPTPATPVHQDPGAAPEAATAPVIAESLQKAAKKEERPLAEMKAELLGMIDAAIKETPNYKDYLDAVTKFGKDSAEQMYARKDRPMGSDTVEGKGSITFDVPGDGKFRVTNSFTGLSVFRAKIAKASGNGFSETKRPGLPASTSVKKGSTNQISAIESMLEDGDLQAANDYMAAVGIGMDGLSKSTLARMEQLEALGDKAQEALYTRIDPEWQYSVDRGSRRATLTRTIGKDVYRAWVNSGVKENGEPNDFGTATYSVTVKGGKAHDNSAPSFHDALVFAQNLITLEERNYSKNDGAESQDTPASKAKDTEKVSGAPAELDLMGFTKTPTGNGTFTLSDSNMRVTVEPTGTGFQARMGSGTSGPRLTEQQAIEWAATMRDESIRIQKAEAKAKPEVSKTGKLPVFPVDAYRLERFYANGAKIKPLPARTFSLQEVQSITDWFKSIGWSVTSGSGGNGINATNDIGMTIDDLPEPYTAAQRKKDEALLASDERAAAKKKEQEGYLTSTAAGKFVAGMFGDAMNRYNQVALAKVLSGDEKTFAGLFSNSAADVLSEAGISAEGREIKDVIRDIKAMFDAAPTSAAKEPWQMTEAEFGEVERQKALANIKYDLERAKNGSLKPFVSGDKSKPALVRRLTAEVAQIESAKPEGYAGDHLAQINKALREGKPVPEVNLKRYDIAAPAVVDMDPAEFKRRLDVYNQTLQAELDKEIPVDAAHLQALGMAGLTGDGLRKARTQNGLPNTDKAGTWGIAEKQSIANQTFDQWVRQNYEDNEYKASYLRKANGNEKEAMLRAATGWTDADAKPSDMLKEARRKYFSELTDQPREASISLEVFDALSPAMQTEAQRHFYDLDSRLTRRTQDDTTAKVKAENAAKKPYEDALAEVSAEIARLDKISGPETQKQKDLSGRRARLEEAIWQIGQGKEPDGRLLKKDAPAQDPATPEQKAPANTGLTYPLAPAGTRYEETSTPITMMTPDAYLAEVRPLDIDEASRDNIDDLKAHIMSGKTLDPLHIRADGKEDGRHRAVAAKELGIAQVPVVDARASKAEPSKIENFGVELPPARRTIARQLSESLSNDDIARLPLSQVWPASEIDAIYDPFVAAAASVMREAVPSKPRTAYKVKAWAEKVQLLRSTTAMLVSGRITREQFTEKMGEGRFYALRNLLSKIKLLEKIDRSQWARIGEVQEWPDAVKYDNDGKQVSVPQAMVTIDDKRHSLKNSGDLSDHMDAITALLAGDAKEKRMAFEIRGSGNSFFINKTGDKQYRHLMEFTSAKDARDALESRYKDVVAAWEAVKERDNITERDLRSEVNRERAGRDWRNGKDVTAEEFQQQFGFRGGEFGKWVAQGKGAQERQFTLNSAYDALMDLADILGIPPRAISLEGTLGIAFGSRGSGWASAHFEPSNLVINLTKPRGAGALAHEWFHALDNYFARKRNDGQETPIRAGIGSQQEYRSSNYITHRTTPMMVRKDGSGSRVTKERLAAWRKSDHGRSADLDASNWIEDPRHKQGVRAEVEERFENLVKALNESPMSKRARLLDGVKESGDGYWSRTLERAARSFENYIQSQMLANGYHNDFLANVREAAETKKSLERYPYLMPSEIAPIADAFAGLFETVQTQETEDGNVAMFSRGTPFSPAAQAQSIEAVERVVSGIADAWQNGPRIVVAFDMQDARIPERIRLEDQKQRSGGARGTPEGFYYDGTAYLMASQLKTPNDTARVLFHEALGHFGLRRAFGGALKPILQQIVTMRRAQVDAKVKEYGLRGVSNLDRLTAAEEVLAEMAQTTPEIGFVKRAIAAIRTWLRAHVPGFKDLALTDDEIIRSYILPARGWVERGPGGGGPKGGVSFARGAKSSNAENTRYSRQWYDRLVGLLPDSYRNDPYRREPLPAEGRDVQQAREVQSKIDALNKQIRGPRDTKGHGPVTRDELGNLTVDAREATYSEIIGEIKDLADEIGYGVTVTGVQRGLIEKFRQAGFESEISLAAIADRITGARAEISDEKSAYAVQALGTIMSYKPRGFPMALFSRADQTMTTAFRAWWVSRCSRRWRRKRRSRASPQASVQGSSQAASRGRSVAL